MPSLALTAPMVQKAFKFYFMRHERYFSGEKEKGIAEKLQLQTSFESDINSLQNFKAGVDSYLNDLKGIIQNHEYSQQKTRV